MGYFESKKLELQELLLLLNKQKSALETSINYIKRSDGERGLLSFEEQMEAAKEAMKHITQERKIGVPWLAKAYDDYFELQERGILSHLQKKSQPAIKAAEIVREYSRLRRDAERRARIAESLLAYYEYVAPFLVDLKEEAEDLDATDSAIPQDFSEEELADEVTGFLTKDEYHNLSVSERNQLALDRYWSRPKSKSTIGRMYERYIGYIFECQGYSVEYHGIFEGFADLGRDLICETEAEAVLIQCKNWSHFRRIHEKHIFQFFGTVFEYRDSHPARKVRALFYTSTEVSDLARRFSRQLGIELFENVKLQQYPCIKCNVSHRTGERIYHLPFDQQYDRTTLDPKRGEFYCLTVRQAEELGFRRAFKYRGTSGPLF